MLAQSYPNERRDEMDEQFIKAETLARTLAGLRPPEPATDEALPVEEADWQASSFLADLLFGSEPEAPPLDRTTVSRLAGHGKGAADRWSEALRSLEAKYVIRYVLGKLRVPHGVRIAAIKGSFGDLRADEIETLKKILKALPAAERARRTISRSSFRELAGRHRTAHRMMPDDRAVMSLIGIEAHGRRLVFSAGRGGREVWTSLASKVAALSWQRIFRDVPHVTVDSLRRWLGLVDPLDFWGQAPNEMSRDARDRFLDLVLEVLLDEPDLQGGWGTERVRIQRELDDPWSEPHIPVPDEGVRSLADLHDWFESSRVFEHIRWSARDELDGLLYSLLATDPANGAYRNRCARIAQLSQAAAGIPHLAVNLHWQIKRHRPEALAWLLARIDTSAFALILLSNLQVPIQDAWDDFSGRFAAQQERRLGVWRQSLRVYWASIRSANDDQQRAQAVSDVLRTLVLQRIWPGPIQPQLAGLASETAVTQLALFQAGLAREPAHSGHPRPLLLPSVLEPVTATLGDAFSRNARFEHATAPKLLAWSTLLAASDASDPDTRQLHRDVQKRLAGEILGSYLTLIREAAGTTPDATGKMPIVHWHDDEPFVAALDWGNVARHLDAVALNSLMQPVNFLAVSKDIPVKARAVRDPHVRIDDEVAWAAHVLTETWARKARLHLRVLLALLDIADEIETLGANTVRRWILDLARLHGPGVPEKGGLPVFRPSPVGFPNQADELSGLVLKAVVGLPTEDKIRGLEAWIWATLDLGLLLELARFDQPGETRTLILNHIATIDLDQYLRGEEWIQNVERAADAAALLGDSNLAERILSYGEKEFTGRPHWDDFAYRFRLRMAFQRKDYAALKGMPAPVTDDQARSAELQEAKDFFETVSLFETDPIQAATRLKDLLRRRPSAYLAVNVLAARIGAADRESGAARLRLLREALQEWDDLAAQIPDARRAEIQLVAAAHRLAINDRLTEDSVFDEIWVSLPKEHQFSEQFLPLRVANLLRRELINDATGLVDTAAAYHGYSANPSWFQAQIDLVRAKVPPPALSPALTLPQKPSVAEIASYFRMFRDLDHENQAASLYPEAVSWNQALLSEYAAPVSQFLTMLRSLVNIAGRQPIHEDRLRDLLVAMLKMRLWHLGWHVEPNSPGGSSETGASPGIRDWVLSKRGVEVAVGEALRLSVVDYDSITRHRAKLIDRYGASGARQLYLVVFCEADDFIGFCDRYRRRLSLGPPLTLPDFGTEVAVFEEEPEPGHILHHLLVHLKLPPIKRPKTLGKKKTVRRERATNRS